MDEQTSSAAVAGAWLRYQQSLQEMQQQALLRYQELWIEYLQAVQSALTDGSDRAAESYRTYVQDVQAALNAAAPQQAVIDAHQAFVATLEEIRKEYAQKALDSEAARRLNDSYNAYNGALGAWISGLQNRLNEAGQKYASTLSEAASRNDAAENLKAAYDKYVEGFNSAARDAALQSPLTPKRP